MAEGVSENIIAAVLLLHERSRLPPAEPDDGAGRYARAIVLTPTLIIDYNQDRRQPAGGTFVYTVGGCAEH